jgi:hypothetical protein
MSTGFNNLGFNKNERAYYLSKDADSPVSLKFEIAANNGSPLVNPAFIIKKWGIKNINLFIDGQPVHPGNNFRYDYRKTLEGRDLIVWIDYQSTQPVSIAINPIQ